MELDELDFAIVPFWMHELTAGLGVETPFQLNFVLLKSVKNNRINYENISKGIEYITTVTQKEL